MACRLFAKRVDRFDRGIESVKQRVQLGQKALAGIGRGDAACRAVQQPDAEPGFERPHGLAERRGRKPETLAAFVKLACSATATKTLSSAK